MSAAASARWPWIWPLVAWIVIGVALGTPYGAWPLLVVALVGVVLAAVHHAEVIAERIGEPFGTLVLAVAVTIIEVALIVALMLADSEPNMQLPRDTVFAAVMIIITGMVGLCLLTGGRRHGENTFGGLGVSSALATLASLSVLTLVLPNYTTSMPGAAYSASQLAFVALVSLVLYGAFIFVQTVKHRDYFLDATHEQIVAAAEHDAQVASRASIPATLLALLASLGAVVLLAKSLAPTLTAALDAVGAPDAATGVFIAAIVLLPESLAAYRAAVLNRLQTSLNLALGSALASIGLTIPAVAALSLAMGWTLELGLGQREIVLLVLALFVSSLSVAKGRTMVLHGVVHLVLFAVYLFTTIVP
ncbi:MAG: ionic transporter y4hA [Gammaproteobacteria bacterium]|nr:ionic transporter y4hA [Gammaproteobacteria bacterium]